MNSRNSNANAMALSATPLFASSWVALFKAIRAQMGENPQRRTHQCRTQGQVPEAAKH